MTRRTITGWEAETLHAMSEAYAVQAAKAARSDCMSPWNPQALTTEAVASKVLSFFDTIAEQPEQNTENKLAQKIPKPPRKPRV